MQPFLFDEGENKLEIGVDEAGRGPMFGRVYAAAVLLPRGIDYACIKDSKRFTSARRLGEAAAYVQDNALAWAVAFEDEKTIDDTDILAATQRAMHRAINDVRRECIHKEHKERVAVIVDGSYFKPLITYNKATDTFDTVETYTLTKGDNLLSSIAAASILAKWHRDAYIASMCTAHPALDSIYGLASNKGYGGKRHMDAIREHGVSPWHRMTFGLCATVGKQCPAFDW